MSRSPRQQQILEDWNLIDDPQERLAALVERARTRTKVPVAERTDALRVRGCVSAAWIQGQNRGGLMHFLAAADSPLVEGLLGLLCEFFSAEPPAAVVASDDDPIGLLGLSRNLSPTRQAGLASARERLRELARLAVAASIKIEADTE